MSAEIFDISHGSFRNIISNDTERHNFLSKPLKEIAVLLVDKVQSSNVPDKHTLSSHQSSTDNLIQSDGATTSRDNITQIPGISDTLSSTSLPSSTDNLIQSDGATTSRDNITQIPDKLISTAPKSSIDSWNLRSKEDTLNDGNNTLLTLNQIDDARAREISDEFQKLLTDSESTSPSLSQDLSIVHQSQSSTGSIYCPAGRNYDKKDERGFIDVLSESVVEALDHSRVSDRRSVQIIAAVASTLGHDIREIVLNESSFRRKRILVREKKAENIKKLFGEKTFDFVTVHWDGKLIPNSELSANEERLPIVVSAGTVMKILNVPALENGKGETQADAIYEALYDWGLLDLVAAVCCDTTNSNLGCRKGAAVILEKNLNKSLLYLPCRHHIMEIILGASFAIKIPKSNEPNVFIFKQFRSQWNNVNTEQFSSGVAEINPLLQSQIPDLTGFIKQYLKQEMPRDDYKEMLELCLLFIGVAHPDKVIKRPGACHHARWMSKAIYSLKMYLFREQINLSVPKKSLLEVCQFIVFVYIKAWYSSPLAASAPCNDLDLLKTLNRYKTIDHTIAHAALLKLKSHLWYLSPECAALSFFNDKVSLDVKRKMVNALDKIIDPDEETPKKFDLHHYEEVLNAEMDYFINSQSGFLFDRLKLDKSFLELDPSDWPSNELYLKSKSIVETLLVVNDVSERAVKLAEDYLQHLTKKEDQKQCLIQIIENYRKKTPDAKKETMVKKFKTK